MDRKRLLELAGVEGAVIVEEEDHDAKQNIEALKTFGTEGIVKALKNAGLHVSDNSIGDVVFSGRENDGQVEFIVAVENNNEGTWDVSHLYIWVDKKDGLAHADFPGNVELEGFVNKGYANEAVHYMKKLIDRYGKLN